MLAVTIDEVPDGDESRRRPLAAMRIEPVSGSYSICEYEVCSVENRDGLMVTSASCVVERRGDERDVLAIVESACRAVLAAEKDGP